MPCAATVGTFDRGSFTSDRLQAAYPGSTRVRQGLDPASGPGLADRLAHPTPLKRVIPVCTVKQPAGTSNGPFSTHTGYMGWCQRGDQLIFNRILVAIGILLTP